MLYSQLALGYPEVYRTYAARHVNLLGRLLYVAVGLGSLRWDNWRAAKHSVGLEECKSIRM